MRHAVIVMTAALLSLAAPLRATIPVIDLRKLDSLHRPWLPQTLRRAEWRIHAQAYWQQLEQVNRLEQLLERLAHEK